MQFSRFDKDFKREIQIPIEKQKKILSDIERRELVKDLPGNQKAKLRRVK